MPLKELRKLPKEVLDYGYPVQVFEGFHLGPKVTADLDAAEMFNHSCDPNAGVKGQIILVARRKLKIGEEICFDYETTDTQDLNFTCKRGSNKCRVKIKGDSWKNLEFQKKNRGYLSWYIEEKIRKSKKIK